MIQNLTFLLLFCSGLQAFSQPGKIDNTFNPADINNDRTGASGGIATFILLSDEAMILAGVGIYNGSYTGSIAKIKPDGAFDHSFKMIPKFFKPVTVVIPRKDGKFFVKYDSSYFSYIALIDASGNKDVSFESYEEADHGFKNSVLKTITALDDGKVIVGGILEKFNTYKLNMLVRLTAKGDLDTTFNVSGSGPNRWVHTSSLQSDGKIIIGGEFTAYNSKAANCIARLEANGQFDSSFNNGGTGADSTITKVVIQTDGKLIILGEFKSYNGVKRNRIARLNGDGTLDATFDPGTAASGAVCDIALQKDGKMVVIGSYEINGININQIFRLNANGSMDSTFNTKITGGEVHNVFVRKDGKIMICGDFVNCDDIYRGGIVRLNTDGSIDLSFNPIAGFDAGVTKIIPVENNKAVVVGNFNVYNNTVCRRMVQIDSDGNIDKINTGIGANTTIYDYQGLTTGKIMICGLFNTYNTISRTGLAQLNKDWSLDTSFKTDSIDGGTLAFKLQNDGKIIIGGEFKTIKGLSRNSIARLNADGTLDESFNPGTGANGSVRAIFIQPDSKIIVCGNFTLFNGVTKYRIVRLNTDGSIDNTYNTHSGANGNITCGLLQTDGKLIIGGIFTIYNGQTRTYIARVNTDGSHDNTFKTTLPNYVYAITPQADNKLIVSGMDHLTRINSDGSVDNAFEVGILTDVNNTLFRAFAYTTAIQDDGKILVAGNFRKYNTIVKNNILRLLNDISSGVTDYNVNPTLTLYPNPSTHQKVCITATVAIDAVRVYDLLAHQVLSVKLKNSTTSVALDTDHLSVGIYLVHVNTKQGEQIIKMVIEE